ncbi:FKBP-type peptidyl-prolyl cis-trans isomerase [Gemmatimonas sp.]|jgi:FKBP-type peptidyl-prolyl cis-trans isomerase|uniref:FKBP-type peptidyl-prolyl cis-trans isomerase n=1 Tax=Gemmatimonas sp. TaxID=1962908 RepID=UPI0037C02D0F
MLLLQSLRSFARRTVPVLGTAALLSACSSSDNVAPNIPSNPAVETYAPITGVNIAQMTKRNDNLFVQDVAVGTGAEAAAGRTVDMRYTGYLVNGSIFDTNASGGRPVLTFVLGAGQVISGWDLGVAGMKVGGKRKLVIGSALAYGNQSPDTRTIPNNATLVFDVELLAVR